MIGEDFTFNRETTVYWGQKCPAEEERRVEIAILRGECWYGGCTMWGVQMPLHAGSEVRLQLEPNLTPNQAMPLLVSSRGRYLWLEGANEVMFSGGKIYCPENTELGSPEQAWTDEAERAGRGETEAAGCKKAEKARDEAGEKGRGADGQTLRCAYRRAMERHFPFSGKMPAQELFGAPVFNTWIELTFDQNQRDVLRYAHGILESGFAPGVLMIDDGWAECYGDWRFHTGRFPDPAGMLRELHGLGFRVMLWVCPDVTPDSRACREAAEQGLLLRNEAGELFIAAWWNGFSAALDLGKPAARDWLRAQLEALCALGVDGFKFDGGDPAHYVGAAGAATPNGMARLWAEFGERWPFNEYRAGWKAGGMPLLQRLCDKDHSWGEAGLAALVPDLLAQGITGHPFGCADLVGGGEYRNFWQNADRLDGELVVKHSAVSCLTPTIQFSAAPWRVLDPGQLGCIHAQLALRSSWQAYLEETLKECARTGEPAVRYMEYEFPHQGMERVRDQFMLGGRLLVAPILEKGQDARNVYLPRGEWRWEGRTLHSEGEMRRLAAPGTFLVVLERLRA